MTAASRMAQLEVILASGRIAELQCPKGDDGKPFTTYYAYARDGQFVSGKSRLAVAIELCNKEQQK